MQANFPVKFYILSINIAKKKKKKSVEKMKTSEPKVNL